MLTTFNSRFGLNRQLAVFELAQVRECYLLIGSKGIAFDTDAASLLLLFVQQPERVQQGGVGSLGDLNAFDHGMTPQWERESNCKEITLMYLSYR